MRLAVAIASLVLVLTARAAAQPGGTPPPQSVPPGWGSLPTAPAAAPAADDPRSESTALLLSLGGAATSWAVLLAGAGSADGTSGVIPLAALSTLFAPGLGHWYVGEFSGGWFAMRGAALVSVLYVASRCEDECSGGNAIAAGAFLLYLAGTMGDIVTAPAAARRYNEEHRALRGLTVAPMLSRSTTSGHTGGHTSGLMLGARF